MQAGPRFVFTDRAHGDLAVGNDPALLAERRAEVVAALSSMGVEIALDDFGTGASSLELIRTDPGWWWCRSRASTPAPRPMRP